MEAVDLSGQKFGRWTVLSYVGRNNLGKREWQCRCDCGTMRNVTQGNLRTGDSNSCGCLHHEHIHDRCYIHGRDGKNPTYGSWYAMRQRCNNPNSERYDIYGALGVKICERWNDFLTFVSDMGERPLGKTLDRWPDPFGNYEPGNCRWATPKEQRNNCRRRYKLDIGQIAYIQAHRPTVNRILAEKFGVSQRTIRTYKAMQLAEVETKVAQLAKK
jgi:hypothetical protein